MADAPPPASWYEDPWHQAGQRWWDGSAWTGHVAAAGSLLECTSVGVAFDLTTRACRLLDGTGADIGSVGTGDGASAGTPGAPAAPQAGELMVATPGDMNQPSSPPFAPAQQAALAAPQPVPVRDAEGGTLFTLRPAPMGPAHSNLSVTVHGPDSTELGSYQSGSAGGHRTVELRCGEQRVAVVSRQAPQAGRKQLAVCGTDGTPLTTVALGEPSASSPALSLTITVVAPVSAPLRHLAVVMPLGFLALALSTMPAMPVMPAMPAMPSFMPKVLARAGVSMAVPGDMGARMMGVMLARMFDSLAGD